MLLDKPLETPRLILQSLSPQLVDERYVRWLNDDAVNRYLEVRFTPQTIESVRKYVDEMNASKRSLLVGIFMKQASGMGMHIGNIKLGPIDWPHRRSELGYVIGDKAQWGKGYATEAMRRFLEYAFDIIGLAKVTGGAYAANVASHKVYLKAGFTEEARLKAHWLTGTERDDSVLFAYFPRSSK